MCVMLWVTGQNLSKQRPNCLIKQDSFTPGDSSPTRWPPSCRLHQGIFPDYFLSPWQLPHTHLEVSHPGQPFSAKPPPHSSSPVRGTKHLSATAKHLELIKQLAPPTEHPPLASKHPETNTTSLTLEVNKLEENKGSQCAVRGHFQRE